MIIPVVVVSRVVVEVIDTTSKKYSCQNQTRTIVCCGLGHF